ncbi:MAG: hypothetical protein JWN50_741 [Parcubacteria group bacterium]|nr:hypothetical protein [Parcubacteria group bacterium]
MKEILQNEAEQEDLPESAFETASREAELESFVEKLKAKFPAAERIIDSVGGHVKLFSLVALMGGSMEAAAQTAPNARHDIETSKVVQELGSLPLREIRSGLDEYTFHLPKDQRIAVSNHIENYNDRLEKKTTGSLPDEMEIGDRGVQVSDRLIKRGVQTISTKFDETIESLSTSSFEITDRLNDAEVENAGDTLSASGQGKTREEAIIEAIKYLSMAHSVNAIDIEVDDARSVDADVRKKFTKATAVDALNYLKNIRVVSIKAVEVAGTTIFEAKLEAEGGKIHHKE